MPKSRTTILLDFYLPCAVSGLLLAGLIAFTSPITEDEILVAPTVLTSTSVPGDMVAMHTN